MVMRLSKDKVASDCKIFLRENIALIQVWKKNTYLLKATQLHRPFLLYPPSIRLRCEASVRQSYIYLLI